MKIALLNNLYFPYNRGGAEQVVAQMAEDFINQGQTVIVITTKPKKIKEVETPTPTDGLKTYYLTSGYYNLANHGALGRMAWQLTNLFNLRKYWQVRRILRAEKPDLAISHNLMGLGYLVPRLIKNYKIKHEHFLHDIQLLHPSGLMFYGREKKIDSWVVKIYQLATRILFASPATVFSPSVWLLEQHRQRGFFKKSLLEVRPFKKTRAEKNEAKAKRRNFLFVGQIEKHKGIFLLIQAFRKIANPDLTLTIIGDGQELAAARKLAANDERINFVGRLSFAETKRRLPLSDVLIVPSLCYENSPTIISGAQAVGLPVIASRLGGIPEIISPPDVLFNPGDEEDLRAKMIEFIN